VLLMGGKPGPAIDCPVITTSSNVARLKTGVLRPRATTASTARAAWPRYRLGGKAVRFDPEPEGFHWLAIAYESRAPRNEAARRIGKRLIDSGLRLLPPEGRAAPSSAANGALLLFRAPDANSRRLSAVQLREQIRRGSIGGIPRSARVGVPVDLSPGRIKVLDNRFVVRFCDDVEPAEIERIAASASAEGQRLRGRVLRRFIQAGNARLIEFQCGDFEDHLRVIEAWLDEGSIVYGEPDLLAELTDDAFPNDQEYPRQTNLPRQNVDKAWQFLRALDVDLAFGSADVHVATLDRGVDPSHPDFGIRRLTQYHDFAELAPGSKPEDGHGMGVYGIISAATHNVTGIAGIASNAHHIAMRHPDLSSAMYGDILLWAAGFKTGNPSKGWPIEPIPRGADIIVCCHGVNALPLSSLMSDTFEHLTTYGRGGLGTVVVYSAGNGAQDIAGTRAWAEHPCTLAISNTKLSRGKEVLDGVSNFGDRLDLCAQGDSTRSLNHTDGISFFNGTSAAAPAVAATAALMLSIAPSLTWIDVRDILRRTAVRVDPLAATDGRWVDGFSRWYGHGRLDAYEAVKAAYRFARR
jgi:hypothetical protein